MHTHKSSDDYGHDDDFRGVDSVRLEIIRSCEHIMLMGIFERGKCNFMLELAI